MARNHIFLVGIKWFCHRGSLDRYGMGNITTGAITLAFENADNSSIATLVEMELLNINERVGTRLIKKIYQYPPGWDIE